MVEETKPDGKIKTIRELLERGIVDTQLLVEKSGAAKNTVLINRAKWRKERAGK